MFISSSVREMRLVLQARTSLYVTIVEITGRTGLCMCLKLLIFVKDGFIVLIGSSCFVLCFIK